MAIKRWWNNLRFKYKIGIGISSVLFFTVITMLVTMFYMKKIDNETTELSNVSIPILNESLQTDRVWNEVLYRLQAYDQTRNENYLKQTKKSLTKFGSAMAELKEDAANSNHSNITIENISKIERRVQEFSKLLARYEQYIQKESLLLDSLYRNNNQIEKISENIFYTSNKNYHTVRFETVQLMLKTIQSIDINKPLHSETYQQRIENISKNLQTLQTNRNLSKDEKRFIDLTNESIQFIVQINEINDASHRIELKRSETENLIKADILMLSDSGLDQINEMSEIAKKVTKNSKNANQVMLIIMILVASILAFSITASITKALKESIVIAKNISNGVLVDIQLDDRKDEVGELLGALQTMNSNIKNIIHEISLGIENIVDASMGMSQNASKLNDSSTNQAVTIEEISSSIEELNSNFIQKTQRVNQTYEISKEAANGIKDGYRVAQIAGAALNEIVNRVAFIDDLSFQTNILALNAAVEAAHAGEYGKGFATVAAEIQKLAENSKKTAQEIEKYSKNSIKVSINAGRKLKTLIPEIEKTSELINEINQASNEQEIGINQINEAIQQLNIIAQQNAFSSENMSTSSNDLSNLAERLRNSISFFKIDQNPK